MLYSKRFGSSTYAPSQFCKLEEQNFVRLSLKHGISFSTPFPYIFQSILLGTWNLGEFTELEHRSLEEVATVSA